MEQSYLISIKDLEQPYNTKNLETLSLKSISLNINKGEVFGLIGRPDSGKSTLLRCINLLERPLTGVVAIDNKNLVIMQSKELSQNRKLIGYISDDNFFFNSKSLFTNTSLPLLNNSSSKDEIKYAVEKALKQVGLEDKFNTYVDQFNNLNRLKAAIARALVTQPTILLCNDITHNLDHKSTQSIIQLLQHLNKTLNLTIIIASNDLEIIKNLCSSIGIMHQGELVEQTTITELFCNPKTEIAKDFIRATTRLEIPITIKRGLRNHPQKDYNPIVRIAFTECLSAESILSEIIKAFELKINIIQAYQEKIKNELINIMLVEFKGSSEAIEQALLQLATNQLYNETIGYVYNTN